MATHSSILAWRILWTEEPGGLPSMGSHRAGHDWSDLAAAAAYSRCSTNGGFIPILFSWLPQLSRLPFTPTEHRSALGNVHIPQVTTGPGVRCKPSQWNHGGRTSSEPKGVDGEPSGTLPRESAWRVRPLLLQGHLLWGDIGCDRTVAPRGSRWPRNEGWDCRGLRRWEPCEFPLETSLLVIIHWAASSLPS